MQASRLAALAGCAALVSLGLGLGAVLQHEEHLQPDLESLRESSGSAAGNPVPLTALLVVAGAVPALSMLARGPLVRKLPALAAAGVALYALVNLLQAGWPTLVDVQTFDQRRATLRMNLLLFQGPGLASAFVALFGIAAASLLTLHWAIRRLLTPPTTPDDAVAALRRAVGWHALSLPLSSVAATGAVRLVGELPDDQVLARLLLPALAAAILGLEAVGLAKLWHLGRAAADARWSPISLEAIQGLARAERLLVPAVAVLALLGALLPRVDLDILQPGFSFGVNLQNHTVFLVFVLVPHLPRLLDKATAEALQRAATGGEVAHPRLGLAAPLLAYAGAAASLAGAALGTWLQLGTLWTWVLALTPAILPCLAARRSGAALALLMAALAWWALGNTLAASFDAAQGSTLARSVSAELLTLARLAALVLVAWAALLVGRALAPRERPSLTIPLAAALALGAAGIALLELPLEIWVVNRFAGVSVAQGSLLAAQDGSVQMVMHLLTFLVACGALLAVARLVRPEWFLRGGRARAAPAAGPTPS